MVPEFNRTLSWLFRVHLPFSDCWFALRHCSGNGVLNHIHEGYNHKNIVLLIFCCLTPIFMFTCIKVIVMKAIFFF